MRSIALRLLPFAFLGLFLWACQEHAAGEHDADPAWSVQLHLHGSFSEGMGSIDSHSYEAAALGVDALWWSDHDFRISSYRHVDHFGFEGPSEPVDAGESWRVELKRHARDEKLVSLATRASPSTAEQAMEFVSEPVRGGQRSLLLRTRGVAERFQPQACILSASRQLQRRPLAGGVSMRLSILPEQLSSKARPYVRLLLSEHAPREGLELEQYSLRYYLTDEQLEPHREGATYHIPLLAEAGRWNDLELRISEDVARGFPFVPARDNALYRIVVGVEARLGAQSQAYFDELHIEHAKRGAGMYALQAEVLEEVGRLYPDLVQHQGVEISYASRHLNEFSLQAELLDYEAIGQEVRRDEAGDYFHEASFRRQVTQTAVDSAHARGGLISYNHLFGVGMENSPMGRTREAQLEMMRRNRGFGVDLLEVGYRDRAGASLADHLWVWDQMALFGLRPVGTGVSDSHGGPEERWSGRPNNFVSWIYAPDPSKPALLEGLRQGRVFFGDIELFDGKLDLRTQAGWRMGQELVSDAEELALEVRYSGAEPGDLLLIIDGGEELSRRVLEEPAGSLDYRRPWPAEDSSFVRVELHTPSGEPKALSNPLHFLRPGDLGEGPAIRAARLALDLAGVRSESAAGLALDGLELLPEGGLRLGLRLEPGHSSASLLLELSGEAGEPEVGFDGDLSGTFEHRDARLSLEVQGTKGSVRIQLPGS